MAIVDSAFREWIEDCKALNPQAAGKDAMIDTAQYAFAAGRKAQRRDDSARQPVGQEPLWCLHVLGMDDVHPAPSKAHAEKAAAWHNEQFKEQAARLGISIEAKVVPWPHSAESHAAGVAEFIPQWLIPQWQLDALEPNAAPPAQAVDLGPSIPSELAPVAAALRRFNECAEDCDSDGCDIGRDWFDALTTIGLLKRTQRSPAVWTMTAEGERLLALIDSQVVGNG